eukprot:NODE_318_length_11118_cov_0.235049.p4 type:complete len:254 gc:universal NODE_318_length_11118_cov_0.235049:5466-6227(+)
MYSNEVNFLSHMLFGACWTVFIQGIVKCLVVFQNKSAVIFKISVLGLFCAIIEATALASSLYLGADIKLVTYVVVPFWFVMIQAANWVYCLRIRSMGGYYSKHDKYIIYIPWIIFVLQVPYVVISILVIHQPAYNQLNTIWGISFSIAISLLEIYLYLVLLAKLRVFLEYRPNLKTALSYELTGGLLLILILELLLIFVIVFLSQLSGMLRPFTYILRLMIVVKFYDELIMDLGSSELSVTRDTSAVLSNEEP